MAAALAFTMAFSCQEQETAIPDISLPEDEAAYAIHTFGISGPSADTAQTRSSLTADTEEIKTICAFAFDAGTGKLLRYKAGAGKNRPGDPVMIYMEGKTDFEWALPLGVAMDIYAVCNIGKPDTPESLPNFLNSEDLVYKVGSVADMNTSGVPMTAVLEGIRANAGGQTYVLPAERIVSKYTLKMSGMPSGYRITGIRICNVNSETTLFASDEAADESSGLIMGDWATDEDLAVLNAGGRAEFYMLENAQTTSAGVRLQSGSKWFEVHGKLGNDADRCTYLDIISEYEGSSRRDRLYLGRDCITDFDVLRNTVRNITCPAPVSVTPGAGQDALEFTEGVTIGPGQTIELPFSYNLLLSETDPSSIIFTADAGLTLGTPSFAPEDGYSGTGVIPVTCSSGAAIGERLTVRMSAGEASAQTELEVVNAVLSVTISAPVTTLYGNSMQFTAEAVYADGTTVTDPTEFVWSVSNAIALMDNGLLSRNGSRYGNVIVRAEHNGVMSNEVKVAVSQYKVEMLAVPNPVTMAAGETVTCSITYSITNVRSGSVQKNSPTLNSSNFRIVSANSSVATGSLLGQNKFNVKGVSNGETVLNLQFLENTYGVIYLDLPVTVGDYSYALELSESSSIYIETGGSVRFKAWYITKYKGTEESRTDVTDMVIWTSSRSSVASVSDGLVTAVSPGECSIYATYKGYRDGISINVTSPTEYEFVVTPGYVLFSPGGGKQFKAKFYTIIDGVRDSGMDVTDEVEWHSYDNSVVKINDRGYANGVGEGSTTIKAQYYEYIYYVDVDVVDNNVYSNSLVVSPSAVSVEHGGSVDLTATYYEYVNGRVDDSEDVTSDPECVWSSSDESIATVSNGTVTGLAEGSVVITADYGGCTSKSTVTVGSKPVSYTYDLIINPSSLTIEAGKTGNLTAIYRRYADGVLEAETDVTSSATWKTENSGVAGVNKGFVAANGEGSVIITATYDDCSAEAEVNVSAKPVSYTYDLIIDPSSLTIEAGKTGNLKAIYRKFADKELESETDVTSSAIWHSSDPDIAGIRGGSVSASAEGYAVMTATYKGCSAEADVFVSAKPVSYTYDLVVTAAETSFTGGGSTLATAMYNTYIDGILSDSEDVTSRASWTSSDKSVATVSGGHVSVKDTDGIAEISATYQGESDHVTITAVKQADVYTYTLSVSPSVTSGKEGKMAHFKAYLSTKKNGVLQGSADVTDECGWSSSNDDLASHEDAGAFNLLKAGEVTVHAHYTAPDGSTLSASASLTIEPVEIVYDLTISPSVTSAYINEDVSFSLRWRKYVADILVSTTDVTDKADWDISDPNILKHQESGRFTGISEGRVTVTATYEGRSVSAVVNVIRKVTDKTVYIDLGPLSSSGTVIWAADEPLMCDVRVTLMWSADLDQSVDSMCLSAGSSSGTIDCGEGLPHLVGKSPDASFIISGGSTVSGGITYTYILR